MGVPQLKLFNRLLIFGVYIICYYISWEEPKIQNINEIVIIVLSLINGQG